MLFPDDLVVLRGGGDLATGVAYRLHKAGFPLVVLELARPLVVRRRVALATAVLEDIVRIEGLVGRRVDTWPEARALAVTGKIPVLVEPNWPPGGSTGAAPGTPSAIRVLVDARLAKRNIDTTMEQAPLVIALGPGFNAGEDCHAVVETMRGHFLGRVIWWGPALPNTGRPGTIAGKGMERVLRSPVAGSATWQVDIGDSVVEGQTIGRVGDQSISAPFAGVIRGLIAPGLEVPAGYKIGDLDARADRQACFTISDKSLAVGGGVLEAILDAKNAGRL
jgi:xanthine dehydrogenase accessory factor